MIARLRRGIGALALVALLVAPVRAADVQLLDLIEIEFGHGEIFDHAVDRVPIQQLLDGARDGLATYLHARGIAAVTLRRMHARADGRGAVPQIEREIGQIIVRYGQRVEPRELVYAALRGELATLHDPYSVFFTAAEFKRFRAVLEPPRFGGIGAVIAFDRARGGWVIDDVFDGSPAAGAGLAPGDLIMSLDGTALGTLPQDRVEGLLRGPIGSPVNLHVARAADERDVRIARAAVAVPALRTRMLAGNVGYLALRAFSANAAAEVRAAILALRARGATSLVLDLRDNGGGFETEAVRIASLFITQGPILVTIERGGRRVTTNADGKALAAQPLAVLVNGNSASGSELVAAAIADRHVGTIVGATTYGKGLVQSVVPLPDGAAIKLTTARYLSALGHPIDHVGVTPDVAIAQTGPPTPTDTTVMMAAESVERRP